MAVTDKQRNAASMAKIKALMGCVVVPYLIAALAVVWNSFITPGLGQPMPVDLTGKTFVVTGATSGLGLWHVEVLAKWNASLVLPVRNISKGEALAARLLKEFPNTPPAVVKHMDLGSLDSVRNFTAEYTGPVDVLVLNAGILGSGELVRTEDGFEECLQVNYISQFLLTHRLLDRIEQSPAGRIVHVAAKAHEWGNFSVGDMRSRKVLEMDFTTRKLSMMGNLGGSYADSKLAQVLISGALTRRLKGNAVSLSLHPAMAQTGLMTFDLNPVEQFLHDEIMQRANTWMGFSQSKADAPKTQIHVSTHPALQAAGGRYYSALEPPLVDCGKQAEDCGWSVTSPQAADRFMQEDLFEASCWLLDLEDGLCARGPDELR